MQVGSYFLSRTEGQGQRNMYGNRDKETGTDGQGQQDRDSRTGTAGQGQRDRDRGTGTAGQGQ